MLGTESLDGAYTHWSWGNGHKSPGQKSPGQKHPRTKITQQAVTYSVAAVAGNWTILVVSVIALGTWTGDWNVWRNTRILPSTHKQLQCCPDDYVPLKGCKQRVLTDNSNNCNVTFSFHQLAGTFDPTHLPLKIINLGWLVTRFIPGFGSESGYFRKSLWVWLQSNF